MVYKRNMVFSSFVSGVNGNVYYAALEALQLWSTPTSFRWKFNVDTFSR